MAVLISFDIPGVSDDQFEGMAHQLLPQIKSQAGFIAHAGWNDADGTHIREIWENQTDHERWVRDVVMPLAAQRMGGMQAPETRVVTLDHVAVR